MQLILFIVLFSAASVASSKSENSINSQKLFFSSFDYSIAFESKFHENIDSLPSTNDFGGVENIVGGTFLQNITVKANKKIVKDKKNRLYSETKSSLQVTPNDKFSSRSNVENRDNTNVNLRAFNLSQNFLYRRKLERGKYLYLEADIAHREGYFVEKNLNVGDGDYYIIENNHTKYTTSIGYKWSLSKKFSIFPKYQIDLLDYYQDYSSFSQTEGQQDDRLVQNLGLATFYKLNKNNKLRLITQYTKTFSRNKLALDDRGLFPSDGLVEPETLTDLWFDINYSTKIRAISIETGFALKRRDDEVSNARDYDAYDMRLEVSQSYQLLNLAVKAEYAHKSYNVQQAAFIGGDGTLRVIDTTRVGISARFNTELSTQIAINNVNINGNRSFDRVQYNEINLNLGTSF